MPCKQTEKKKGRTTLFVNFLLPLVSLILTVGIGLIIHLDQKGGLPASSRIESCDAGWYHSIWKDGYQYYPTVANNTAFFPFFPYVWRWLGVGPVGISIINGLLFVLGVGFLFTFLSSTWRTKAFYLTVSLLVFYMVPFSESMFYIFGAMMLLG